MVPLPGTDEVVMTLVLPTHCTAVQQPSLYMIHMQSSMETPTRHPARARREYNSWVFSLPHPRPSRVRRGPSVSAGKQTTPALTAFHETCTGGLVLVLVLVLGGGRYDLLAMPCPKGFTASKCNAILAVRLKISL